MSKTMQALGNLVDVNGYKIHVFCTGQGKRNFVFYRVMERAAQPLILSLYGQYYLPNM